LLIGGFLIISVAANHLSGFFTRFNLPLITGLLIIGILSGPFVFGLITTDSWDKLNFINEISLAFIAFAASAELYLKELRNRLNSIKWMTFTQLIVTFTLSSVGIYLMGDMLPFISELGVKSRIAISILIGTIFIARSPASAIALISELRAKGPFTQTVLGVTVLIDFLVIILFTINLSIGIALVNDEEISFAFISILIIEIGASFGLGMLLGKLIRLILSRRMSLNVKGVLIVLSGYMAYVLDHYVEIESFEYLGKSYKLEPLLICIIGSFWITNHTRYRAEFTKILKDISLYIYVPFFTLIGVSLSLDLFVQFAGITLILFLIRLGSIMIGAYLGGAIVQDPPMFKRVGWMPYITQAGVSLGLTTVVAHTFPQLGVEFSTLVISTIVLNQIVGPPLFKWVIKIVGESHGKASKPSFDAQREAIIFGFESHSIALARQLQSNGWNVKLATFKKHIKSKEYPDLKIIKIEEITLKTLEDLDARLAEAVVCLLTDEENYHLSELLYEHIGTRDIVVRLNHRYNFDKFHQLGALIVDPTTAMVSLMDHLVRSPQAASLLLGMEADQDTVDIEVQNKNLHGITLRDLRLPSDLIVLSVSRDGHQIISHGYTRLRLGDYITVVGSKESLEQVALTFSSQ